MRTRTAKKGVPAHLAKDNRWLRCAKVADMIDGVTRQAIRDRIKRGTLECQRDLYSRAVYVRPADVVKEFCAGRPTIRPFDVKEIVQVSDPKAVAVLFAREDSVYKSMGIAEIWDAKRNAMKYRGKRPVVAHPPCRAWGKVRGLAKPKAGEKECAPFALSVVRKNGGIIEHPKGSTLWKEVGLPFPNEFPDEFGGFTIEVDQFDFGHVAHKATYLYIVGVSPLDLPKLPGKRQGKAARSIMGGSEGKKECTQYMREYTPPKLAAWLYETAGKCKGNGAGIVKEKSPGQPERGMS